MICINIFLYFRLLEWSHIFIYPCFVSEVSLAMEKKSNFILATQRLEKLHFGKSNVSEITKEILHTRATGFGISRVFIHISWLLMAVGVVMDMVTVSTKEGVKVISQDSEEGQWKIKEAIHIQHERPSLNRDWGHSLSTVLMTTSCHVTTIPSIGQLDRLHDNCWKKRW